jgi:hypothetical protein
VLRLDAVFCYNAAMFDPEALPVPDLGLRCLTCGYNLAALPEHRCPECGRAFTMEDHIPKGDFPVVIFNGKEVVSTPSVVELLKRMRIPYMEVTQAGDDMYGFGGLTHVKCRVGVPRASYFEVIDLLRRQALGQPLPEPEEEAEGPEWTCSCGEANPGNFELCWNCGEPRAGGG